jgi:hypothetical protein
MVVWGTAISPAAPVFELHEQFAGCSDLELHERPVQKTDGITVRHHDERTDEEIRRAETAKEDTFAPGDDRFVPPG